MRRLQVIVIMLFCLVTGSYAQNVTLTVHGQAATKETAITQALRSAIEQAYGVFVSANTELVNGKLTKDEIVTVSSGNIQSYKEMACASLPNGDVTVTLSATVSIDNLVAYAKSHGSRAEFAGKTLAMNMKMIKINKDNELSALGHLLVQLRKLVPHMFDHKLYVGDVPVKDGGYYKLPMTVVVQSNEASDAFYKLLKGTLQSLSLNGSEEYHYKSMKLPYYHVGMNLIENTVYGYTHPEYELRNDPSMLVRQIGDLINKSVTSFVLKKNGNISGNASFSLENDGIMARVEHMKVVVPNSVKYYHSDWEDWEGEAIQCNKFDLFTAKIKTKKKKGVVHKTVIPQLVCKLHGEIYIKLSELDKITGFELVRRR